MYGCRRCGRRGLRRRGARRNLKRIHHRERGEHREDNGPDASTHGSDGTRGTATHLGCGNPGPILSAGGFSAGRRGILSNGRGEASHHRSPSCVFVRARPGTVRFSATAVITPGCRKEGCPEGDSLSPRTCGQRIGEGRMVHESLIAERSGSNSEFL